jgi:hypothetical protein
MPRQIEPRLGEPRLSVLEQRLSELELRVAALTEAVRVLTRTLEGSPVGDTAKDAAAEAARRARELLAGPEGG